MKSENSEIVIYQTQDGLVKISVRLEGETLWLTQAQMTELFQTTKQNISLHINNIYEDGELDPSATVKDYLTVRNEGSREVNRSVKYYSLDVVIAVGYRVKSARGTQFRQWATAVLHEYMQKGFAMNDEKLKEFGGGDYWYELLERIRDIRSSEKAFRAVNRELISMYGEIGHYVSEKVKNDGWGKSVVQKFSRYIQSHFVGIKGFSPQNIWRMRQFF